MHRWNGSRGDMRTVGGLGQQNGNLKVICHFLSDGISNGIN
jgi:hypothetical protein